MRDIYFSPPSCHGPHSLQSNIHVTFREHADFLLIVVSLKWSIIATPQFGTFSEQYTRGKQDTSSSVISTCHAIFSRREHVGQDFCCSFVCLKVSPSCPCFTVLEEGVSTCRHDFHYICICFDCFSFVFYQSKSPSSDPL